MKLLHDYIATDGTLAIFIIHKVGHLLGGMVIALATYHLFHSTILAFVCAAIAGILREFMKITPMYMHVTTAVITSCGWFLALPLFNADPQIQLIIGGCAFVYVMAVLFSIYRHKPLNSL